MIASAAAAAAFKAAASSLVPIWRNCADPLSPFAEAFRFLRTNLYYSGSRERDKIIVVTSPAPGDGKTMTTHGVNGAGKEPFTEVWEKTS